MSGVLRAPRRLTKSDDRSSFTSGAEELDDWFRRFAWQNQQAKNSVVYVAAVDDIVVGYYAICAAAIGHDDAPEGFTRRRPNPIPVVLLARLAVDRRAQGRGVGAGMVRDAVARALSVSTGLGAAALIIHCRDDAAREFDLRHIDLLESPIDPLHLILPLRAAAAALEGPEGQ
ncbi:GNAT family N-acetyltransferase [Tsukamurella pseudospumae]|uniref:GNAT family acetyltransferase n=1 Tax=Tsukamurella pseudospumae TaxID=239498 RepID=A0A137ZY52_9ACTN|nr:GNAT family N-acetyltransferase [Tsukamurella pseudospumae]KXO98188.1 GNAT family acetyltransferase [Tsukamurella pseudospumae]KXP03128.1 GNAT family acetyltransferase [Tsukamurella pseudospumae]